MKWPRSKLVQLLIALFLATAVAISTFKPIMDARMAVYVREYPHDGQDSLGAFMDACVIWLVLEIGISVALYVLQRRLFWTRQPIPE